MIQNYVIAFVRTYVMLGIAWLVTFAAERGHVVITPHTQASLAALAMALISAGYYLLVRLLEHKWPKAGVLLGVPAKPKYADIGKDGVAVITDLQHNPVPPPAK